MTKESERDYRPISDYALIGSPRNVALVSRDGAVDWWCWPRFDSPAIFCHVLDARRGGFFQICPVDRHDVDRSYLDSTNVLTTTFQAVGGRARVTDFLPIRGEVDVNAGDHESNSLLRLIEGVAGEVDLAIRFHPTFGYTRTSTSLEPTAYGAIARGEAESMVLRCPIPLEADPHGGLSARVRVKAGDRIWVGVRLHQDLHPDPSVFPDPENALTETVQYWHTWASVCRYDGPYRDLVQRSALALKLLTFEPTGALVAAPTTSLPESIGGVRNWDYRFTWLRDSSLILEALHAVGYQQEAASFFQWLRSVWVNRGDDLRIMYTIDGEPVLAEQELDFLDGYRSSRPVRVGNAAGLQTQLDIYGEVLDASYFYYSHLQPPNSDLWITLSWLADQAAKRWRERDRGIWEVRGGPQHFLYSKVMCWVALDRAIKLAQACNFPGDHARWHNVRDDIRQTILSDGYNTDVGAFTQVLGGDVLDAGALAIPIVGLLPATDSRVLSTMDRIRERLTSHGLVYRYSSNDGLPDGEGAFTLCSFWMVDNLALAGRTEEARDLFERVVGYANDVGLLSEEIDPVNRELLGNFPQGFSHLALIRSALLISKAEAFGPEHHPTTSTDRAPQVKKASQKKGRQPARRPSGDH